MFIQRSSARLCEGWHRLKGWRGSYVRDLMGHHLVIFHGRTPQDHTWYKWLDGYFKGSAERLAEAKVQLEIEATGGGVAWTNKSGPQVTSAGAGSSTRTTIGCELIGNSILCMVAAVVEERTSSSGESSSNGPIKIPKQKGEADEAIA